MDRMIQDQDKLYTYYNFPKPDHPIPLDHKLMAMRLNFLFEELRETANAAGFYFNPAVRRFQPAKEKMANRDAEKILDGLVDLQVVLLGTAYLMGFFKVQGKYTPVYSTSPETKTIFETAWDRVFNANLRKQVGVREKRSHKMDLIKPEGWEPPKFSDLVAGFYGFCKDCECPLTREAFQEDELKCSACQEAG